MKELDVSDRTIRDQAALRMWFDFEVRRRDGWLAGSEHEWANVQAAAAKARTAPELGSRIGLFKWLVKGRHWTHLAATHEDIAREMRREAEARAGPSPYAAEAAGLLKTVS